MNMDHGDSGGGDASGDGDATTGVLLYAPLWKVVVTGLAFGVVHVLTGPGHLGALVALANGQPWRQSFMLGAQWGCGHSVGVLLVAGVCVALGRVLDFGGVIHEVLNYVMGTALILIGAWTLYHASVEFEAASRPHSKWEGVHCQDASYTLLRGDEADNVANLKTVFTSHSSSNMGRVQQTSSVCMGVLHGFAGPGAVLVVAPIILMHGTVYRPAVYLTCFCASSIVCMGVFAAAYGELTRRSSQQSSIVAFRVACFSSGVTIFVGILWVVLQACGGLDDVFGHHH